MEYYEPKTKRTFFVGQGIGVRNWFTLYFTSGKRGLHRLKSPALPLRNTQEEAQADLDAYALKKKWEAIPDRGGNRWPTKD